MLTPFRIQQAEWDSVLAEDPHSLKTSSSIQKETLAYALKKLHLNQDYDLAEADTLIESLQRNCIRFRQIDSAEIQDNVDYGVLIAVGKCEDFLAVLYKENGLHRVRLFEKAGRFQDDSSSSISGLFDNYDSLYEVYPPLPYDVGGISGFLSFIFSPYRGDIIKVALFTCLASGLQLLFPSLTVYVATHVIALGSISYAIEIGFLAVVLAIVSTGALYLQSQYILKLEAETDKRAQVAVWDRLLKADLNLINQFNSSDLMLRASSVSEIRSILSSSNIASIINILFSFLYIFIMFSYMPKAVFGVMPVVGSFLFLVYRRAKAGGSLLTQSMDVSAELSNESIEMLRLQPEIKARGIESEFLKAWLPLSRRAASLSDSFRKRDNAIEVLSQSLQPICFLVSFIIIVSTTTEQQWNDTSLLLKLLGFTSALSLFTSNLASAAQTVANSVVTVIAYWKRAQPIVFSPIEAGYSPSTQMIKIDGSIDFDKVSFRFRPEAKPVFEMLSLSVEPREIVSLDMPDGSGSSSLFKLVLGIHQACDGLIALSEIPIEQHNIANLRSQVALCPQEPYIPPGPLGDLIDGPFTKSDPDLEELIEVVNLLPLISSLRLGLNTPVPDGGYCFSSAQRLSLSLAIALARGPRLLLLDDALRGLNAEQQKGVLGYCRRRQITVIAHNKHQEPAVISEYDRVICPLK